MSKAFDNQPIFRKTVLANGVTVVTEHHKNTRTTSAGVYVDIGTRDEPRHLSGAAHFIEHLVFKGTEKKSAYDIVKDIEAVGGEVNAYTSREYTCFHTSTLREDLHLGLETLVDFVDNALFDVDEFEKERQVILHEIDMTADQLDEYIVDLYYEKVFPNQTIGFSILGTETSLKKISRDDLFNFYKNYYFGGNLTFAIAGDVNHDRVVDYLNQTLDLSRTQPKKNQRETPKQQSFFYSEKKNSEQSHILLGLPSVSYTQDLRFESYIVNAYLGGGMTSKLYQSIRENKALVYSVYSYLHSMTDSGLLMVYAGTSNDNLSKVLLEINEEFKKLKDNGLTLKDVEYFKKQVKGQIIMGSDDVDNRMNSIAINEMVFAKYKTVDEVISEIDTVSVESIKNYLDSFFDLKKISGIIIGSLEKEESTKKYKQVFKD